MGYDIPPHDPDGLRLKSSDLRTIADALDQLAKVTATVTTLAVGGVTLHVRRHDDQREGAWYTVTSIRA